MVPSTEHLLSIARDYWRPDKDYQLRQEKSPEDQKREARWNQELKKIDQWHAFLRELRQELPSFTIGDGTATPDSGFRCVAYPAKGRPMPPHNWIAVGCVSILAPIYIVYSVKYGRVGNRTGLNPRIGFEPFPPEIQPTADIIARKIEETFGVSKLPREIAETPVPLFVKWVEPPETTLFHALFPTEPDNVP
jgi:hypothetical protein